MWLKVHAPMWCRPVNVEVAMQESNLAVRGPQPDCKRLSISIPREVYQAVEERAATNDVSLAWVVRKALVDYLDRDIPLLRTDR